MTEKGEAAIRAIAAQAVPIGDVPPAPGSDKEFELTLARLPRNDLGNIERFVRRAGHDFIWVKNIGWLAWTGTRWSAEEGEVRLMLAVQDAAAAQMHEARALEDAGEDAGEEAEPT